MTSGQPSATVATPGPEPAPPTAPPQRRAREQHEECDENPYEGATAFVGDPVRHAPRTLTEATPIGHDAVGAFAAWERISDAARHRGG